jgi:hypothetical protein
VNELISKNSLPVLKGQNQRQYVGDIVIKECKTMKASIANGKYLTKGWSVFICHLFFFAIEENNSSCPPKKHPHEQNDLPKTIVTTITIKIINEAEENDTGKITSFVKITGSISMGTTIWHIGACEYKTSLSSSHIWPRSPIVHQTKDITNATAYEVKNILRHL